MSIKVEDVLQNLELAVNQNFQSKAIKNIFEDLKKTDKLKPLIEYLITLFLITLDNHKPKGSTKSKVKKCSSQQNGLQARLAWTLVVRNNFNDLKEKLGLESHSANVQNDYLLLLSCCSEEVFFTWCKNRRKDLEAQNNSKNTSSSSTTTSQMYERSLMTIGGGCIGEIWKVAKKRTLFGKKMELSSEQRKTSQILWDCSLKIRQTSQEKAAIEFSGIGMRDTGGYFIPKDVLNPYLNKLNELCRDILCPEGVKAHGHKILKVVFDRVRTHKVELESCFLNCTNGILPEEKAKIFLVEWQRKFTHALSNEFVTARDALRSEKKNEASKGCGSLRDDLYCLSNKGKSNDRKNERTPKRKTVVNISGKGNSSSAVSSLNETPQKRRTIKRPKRERNLFNEEQKVESTADINSSRKPILEIQNIDVPDNEQTVNDNQETQFPKSDAKRKRKQFREVPKNEIPQESTLSAKEYIRVKRQKKVPSRYLD